MGANERVTLALVGGGRRGRVVALNVIREGGAVIKTCCDIDDENLGKAGAQISEGQNRKVVYEKEFRRVLEDKDIDGVLIVTPDHWHARQAILACQPGKDVGQTAAQRPISERCRDTRLLVHQGIRRQ